MRNIRRDGDSGGLAEGVEGLSNADKRKIIAGFRDRASENFLSFVRYLFPAVDKVRFRVNWHHRLIANRLEQFAKTEGDRLIVSVPVRHGKSRLCSVFLPAWLLGRDPNERIIAGSHGEELAKQWSKLAKQTVQSRKFRQLFPNVRLPSRHVDADSRYQTKNTIKWWEIVGHTGQYLARGVGQAVSGRGADTIIIDDPHDADDAATSEAHRQNVINWWRRKISTRVEGKNRVLVVCTRFHRRDLPGYLMDDGADDWDHIRIPAIAEADSASYDPRDEGEALWPWRMPLDRLRKLRNAMPGVFATIYQQRPSEEGGSVVQESDIRRWTELPDPRRLIFIQSWDLRGGGDGKGSSYTVGQLWAVPTNNNPNIYLVDQKRGKWEFRETVRKFEQLANDVAPWSNADIRLVEDEADGGPLINSVRKRVRGVVPVNPTGSKWSRLTSTTLWFAAGNVLVPARTTVWSM